MVQSLRIVLLGRFAQSVFVSVLLMTAGCGGSTEGGAAGTAGGGGAGGMAGDAGAGGVGGSVLCAETDCDDGNACTDDLCDLVDGSCSNPALADGANCSAGENPGQCSSGVCVGLCAEADCDDNRECTEDLCDWADGTCSSVHRPDGSTCDFRGLPGRCASGTCADAALCGLVDCSDGNDCTEDVCNPANAACSNPNKIDGAFCETDGNPGLCSSGRCQGLCELVSCDDGNQCTVDMCDPSNGSCPNPDEVDGTTCDYGDNAGKCSGGLCVGLCAGVVCNDHNQCTSDVCDPGEGTCVYDVLRDGASCDIGGVADVCISGTCGPSEFPCTEQGIRDAIARGHSRYTFACNGPTTVATDAEIVIDNDVILDGEGNLVVDARDVDDPQLARHRVFQVRLGITAGLIGMTVTGGGGDRRTVSYGSGILNAGTLTIARSSITGNGRASNDILGTFSGSAGGIGNSGTLTLADSSVSDNSAGFSAGGIGNSGTLTLIRSEVSRNNGYERAGIDNSGTLTLIESTVSGNRVDGGRYGCSGSRLHNLIIYNSGTMQLMNSTVSHNSGCSPDSGIIASDGPTTLINSTVSMNSAGRFGLIAQRSGVLTLINCTVTGPYNLLLGPGEIRATNTVIALSREDPGTGCGYVTSGGGNIESPGDDCGFDQPTDQVNVSADDLKLGPLQDNGGPTQTHALLPGSVAIDVIPEAMCEADEDQRGEPRPGGTMCDVGAFEVQP